MDSSNPYSAPRSARRPGEDGTAAPLTLGQMLFSFKGRIRRSQYWGSIVAFYVLGFCLGLAAPSLGLTEGGDPSPVLALFLLAFAILTVWCSLAIQVKRFHDRDKSGLWILFALVPIIGWLFNFVELGFFAGTPGRNRFGPPPA